MKRTTFVLFSLIATISVSAQEVVSTQGDSYTNASGSIDFTIGEVIINTGNRWNQRFNARFSSNELELFRRGRFCSEL